MSSLSSYRDGSLGSSPMMAFKDGSLGVGNLDMSSYRSGSLGCGCSMNGLGEEAAATTTTTSISSGTKIFLGLAAITAYFMLTQSKA